MKFPFLFLKSKKMLRKMHKTLFPQISDGGNKEIIDNKTKPVGALGHN